MKGHDGMKVSELNAVIRSAPVRYPQLLGKKKAEKIVGMKKHGLWESGKAKGGPKSKRKPKGKKKLDKGQKDFLKGIK